MQASLAEQVLEGVPGAEVAEEAVVSDCAPTASQVPDDPPMRPGNPTLEQLLGRAEAMGIDAGRFQQYADRRWGSGWKINPHGRSRVWDDLEHHANDPEGYADKIDCALSQPAVRQRGA